MVYVFKSFDMGVEDGIRDKKLAIKAWGLEFFLQNTHTKPHVLDLYLQYSSI